MDHFLKTDLIFSIRRRHRKTLLTSHAYWLRSLISIRASFLASLKLCQLTPINSNGLHSLVQLTRLKKRLLIQLILQLLLLMVKTLLLQRMSLLMLRLILHLAQKMCLLNLLLPQSTRALLSSLLTREPMLCLLINRRSLRKMFWSRSL